MQSNEAWRDDAEFRETRLKEVRAHGDSWTITAEDGWSFLLLREHGVEPRVGMLARFFGRGLGHPVRGLVLDGACAFYRTKGANKITLCWSEVMTALQEYLDQRLSRDHAVRIVSIAHEGYGESEAIVVHVVGEAEAAAAAAAGEFIVPGDASPREARP